jgi:hypothetical protein
VPVASPTARASGAVAHLMARGAVFIRLPPVEKTPTLDLFRLCQ